MADNNKNPRRTIWLSETEPLSHYDIWLSKNRHLNSDGEPISDSGVLRPCDYIFKVWDCDNWYPIIGFNSTAINKINTVYNTSYTTTHNGHSINSSSYLEFHLPLFTNPNSSPLELFDAGTIGKAVLEYVTELEWLNIFEGDAFSNSFKLYFPTIIHNGDISINQLLEPADHEYLGGIWADTFSIEDMFPDSEAHDAHSQTEINDSYNWIAQAKYKLNHGTSDYNLYVNAKDIIEIINQYQEDNPDAPTINIDVDILVQLLETILKNTSSIGWRILTTSQNPSISPDIWGVDSGNAGKFLKIKDLFPSYGTGWSQFNNAMEWVDLREIIPDLINEGDIFVPKDGINISYVLPHGDDIQYVEFGLNHIAEAIDGAVCRKITLNGLSDIEWTLLDDIYSLLTADSSSDGKYVIKGGGSNKLFLRGDGEWTEINLEQLELIEGNGFNTFVLNNKIYIGAYACVIQANDFTLDTSVLINVSGSYSNNHYPLASFVDYLVEHQNGISRIKIESDNQVYLPYPSYMHFTTSDTKCTFIFPQTMEFIETKSVNSLSGEDYYYTDADYYIIELKAETKYNATFYKNCIKFETNSNSIFEQQSTDET